MIGMKPKDVIKLDTVKLNKTSPEKKVLPKGKPEVTRSCKNITLHGLK